MADSGKEAVRADVAVVSAAEVRALEKRTAAHVPRSWLSRSSPSTWSTAQA